MKELILLDRQKRDGQNEEIVKQSLELQQFIHSIKNELLEKIKLHREEYLNIFNESEE